MTPVQAQTLQQLSPCDVAALEKCLKENKGDREKCLEEINAFQRACGKAKPAPQPVEAAAASGKACSECQ